MSLPINFPKHEKMEQNPSRRESLENWYPLFSYMWVCFLCTRFSSYDILHHMENAWISPSVYHSTWKCSKTLWKGRTRKLNTHTFSKIWVLFFHQIPNPMVYFIKWVMHRFSHQFLIASENTAKLILWETPILFLKYGYFSFIKFPRCSYY